MHRSKDERLRHRSRAKGRLEPMLSRPADVDQRASVAGRLDGPAYVTPQGENRSVEERVRAGRARQSVEVETALKATFVVPTEDPACHACRASIEKDGPSAEGESQHRLGHVVADTGKAPQSEVVVRHFTAVSLDQRLRD